MDIAEKAIGRVTEHPAVEPRIMPVFPPDDGSALLSMQFLSVLPGVGPAPAHWSIRPADSPQDVGQPTEATDDRPERTEKREEDRKPRAASDRAETVARDEYSRPKARAVPGKDKSPTAGVRDAVRREEPQSTDRAESHEKTVNGKAREQESRARQEQDHVGDGPRVTVRTVREPAQGPRVRRPAPTRDAHDVESRAVSGTHVQVADLRAAEPQNDAVSPHQTMIRPAEPDRPRPRIPRLSGPEKQDSSATREVNVRIGTVEVRAEPPDRSDPPSPRPGPAGFGDYTAMRCYVPGAEGRSRQ